MQRTLFAPLLIAGTLALPASVSTAADKIFAGDSKPYAGQTSAQPVITYKQLPNLVPLPRFAPSSRPTSTRTASGLQPIEPVFQRPARTTDPTPLVASTSQAVDPITTASTGCKNRTKTFDRDIRKAKKALAGACIELHKIREAGRTWSIYTITRGKPGPLWAVLHDNENAAFSAAAWSMKEMGGTIVAVEAGERRNFRGKDPNRNFGTKCGNGRKYTKFIMNRAKGSRIIAMHSNAAGYSGGGGSGHINVFRKSRVLQGRPNPSPKKRYKSGDDFIMIPGKSEAKSKIRKIHRYGMHAMYERVTRAGDDCSMSNHVVLRSNKRYFNVEVRHGRSSVAREMARIANRL